MTRYKKGIVGTRRKNSSKKKQAVHHRHDHSYTKSLPLVLDDETARNVQWDRAWKSFFIKSLEETEEPVITNSELTDSDDVSADEFYVVMHQIHHYNPDDNLDDFVEGILRHRRYLDYLSLKKELYARADELDGFTIVQLKKDVINLSQFYERECVVKLTVQIDPSLSAKVLVHRHDIEADHDFWIGLPKYFSTFNDIKRLLTKLSNHTICMGNYEEELCSLIPFGSGISPGQNSGITAYREANFSAEANGIAYTSTIRSTKCLFLISGPKRCSHCRCYRATLSKRIRRQSCSPKTPQSTFSHKTHKHMGKTELLHKYKLMKCQKDCVQADLDRLRRSVRNAFAKRGHVLSPEVDCDFRNILEHHIPEVQKSFPDENSIQRLFWEEQLKYAKLSDKRGMRWHPMVIKWCLYMRSKSRKGYDAAKGSGFINLPSKRTLYDYSHILPNTLGFHQAYSNHLMEEARLLGMLDDDEKSYVGILHDEVKVSEGLVYDKTTGELVGYVDLDPTGNHLLRFEESLNESEPKLATTMLVLMVRGIVTNLRYSFAAFATTGITSDFLYPIIWSTIQILENLGLKPLFITCDGASPNRKFFNLHNVPQLENSYWTWNPFAFEDRKLYFISDVPHLLKTTRNCFANSQSHKKTRDMWKHGHDISWLHIVRFYEEHVEDNLFSKAFKLTREHIDLTPYSVMKVNLAAQVFSNTVANALEDLYGDVVVETVSFVRHMNRFFDCLNVRSLREGIITRNTDKKEYRDVDDIRLDYLLNEFLDFFKSWETSVMARQGALSLSQRKRMQLSHQTITGLNISVKSIVECVRFMLAAGAEYVFTHRFNQDPLEEQFGQYRQKGGVNDNPSVYAVKNVISEMKIIGSSALQPIRGNISNKRPHAMPSVDNTPLSRRKQVRL